MPTTSQRAILVCFAAMLLLALAFPTAALSQDQEGADPLNEALQGAEEQTPPSESPSEGAVPGGDTTEGTTGSTPSSSTPTESSSSGPAGNFAKDGVKAVFEWIWESLVQWLKDLGDYMDQSIFTLPSVEGPIGAVYKEAFKYAQPFTLAGVLVLGIMMLIQHSNYNIAYATQHALPRFVVILAVLSFFPFLMLELSSATETINDQMFPGGSLASLIDEMVSAVDDKGGYTFIVVVGTCFLIIFGYCVLLTCLIKSFVFSLLYVVGPFVMMLWPIPATSDLSRTWCRATIACAAIPIVYTLELKLAEFIVKAPSALFGSGGADDPAWVIIVGVGIFFIMTLTPFWILNWAMASYGGAGGFMKTVAAGVVSRKISSKI